MRSVAYGDIRRKAFIAREKGAAALIVVDEPDRAGKREGLAGARRGLQLPGLRPEGYSDAGLPRRGGQARGAPSDFRQAQGEGARHGARRRAAHACLEQVRSTLRGASSAEPKDGKKLPGGIIVGAHHDHLGKGGRYSLAPHSDEAHVGADDNALRRGRPLEVARELAAKKSELRRDVIFVAFSGEEGAASSARRTSSHWHAHRRNDGKEKPHEGGVYAMLNMDMVGRMRETTACRFSEPRRRPSGRTSSAAHAMRARRVRALRRRLRPERSDPLLRRPAFPSSTSSRERTATITSPRDTADKINARRCCADRKDLRGCCACTLPQRDAALTFKSGAEGPRPDW